MTIDQQTILPARSLWTYEVPESRLADGSVVSATLDLRVTPEGVLTGTVKGARGRADAPGNQPEPPVEIAEGKVSGNRLTFRLWAFDRYHNSWNFEGLLEGDGITLTITRATPDGPVRSTARATRAGPARKDPK